MDTERLWTSAQVADALDWKSIKSVHRALWATRGKLRLGQAISGLDFPLPDMSIGKTNLWDPLKILTWDEARKRAQYAALTRSVRLGPLHAVSAAQVEVNDVIVEGRTRRLVVLDIRDRDCRRLLLVAPRKRDPGHWIECDNSKSLIIRRKSQGESS